MLQPQKRSANPCGCASEKCAKPKMFRINKIADTTHSEPHPATCCSDQAPVAASSCCASDSCASQPSEHSPTSTDDGSGSADGDSDARGQISAALPQDQQFSWKVEGMDCPTCARTIEKAVSAVEGVSSVKVQFATEKLVVSSTGDLSPRIQQAVTQAGFTLQSLTTQSQAKPTESPSRLKEYAPLLVLIALMAASWILDQFNPQLGKIAFIVTTLVGLWPVLLQAIRSTRAGSPFTIETLMSIAALGALFIGATAEAAMVLLLFMVGERLEAFAANRARSGVKALMALIPDSAVQIVDGKSVRVAVADLRPNDVIEVAAGGRLPTDATLLDHAASFDESALTGESVPVERQPGEKVPAGSLCVDRVARLNVASAPGASAIDRILQLIEEADERRAPIERFLDTFSRYYTPAIMLMALLVILIPPLAMGLPWETWIYRGLTLLLIGCPCALVISTPAAITSGLAAATRQGALIKGGAALEQLALIQTIPLDKTGTLTEGKPEVTDVMPLGGVSENELLSLAAAVEAGSHHPLALAIIARARTENPLPINAQARRALAGSGVEGEVAGRKIKVLSAKRLAAKGVAEEQLRQIAEWESSGKTVVVVLQEGNAIGLIAMQDTLREDAISALADLKALGISA